MYNLYQDSVNIKNLLLYYIVKCSKIIEFITQLYLIFTIIYSIYTEIIIF